MANTGALRRNLEEFWPPATELQTKRHQPLFQTLDLPQLRSLFCNGMPRGIVTEISGTRSSGRHSVRLNILAQATTNGEVCAVIDTQDSFHPASAVAAGVCLEHLVWIRCHGSIQHAIRATDLLAAYRWIWSGIARLCEAPQAALNRLSLPIRIGFGKQSRIRLRYFSSVLIAHNFTLYTA